MTNKKCKFSYNDLDDSLIISCREENENVRERFNLGNFIFSLTGRGKIVGVQILNAYEVFSDYNISSSFLDKIEEVNLVVAQKEGYLGIALIFTFQNKQAKIPIPLMNLAPKIR